VSKWREEKKAEKAAGYTPKIMLDLFKCDLCDIGIGPNHKEQELHLWHVVDRTVKVVDVRRYFKDNWLNVCEGCMRFHKLPLDHLVVSPEDYLTRKLLDADGQGSSRPVNMSNPVEMRDVRAALRLQIALAKRRFAGLLPLPLPVDVKKAPERPKQPAPSRRSTPSLTLFSLNTLSTTAKLKAMAGSLVMTTRNAATDPIGRGQVPLERKPHAPATQNVS